MNISYRRPEVSVIMPCYNYEKYLKSSIESILAQTYNNFEFIIINDGSLDKSDDIIKEYIDDRRIRYHHLKETAGNYTARNIGLQTCRGKYVCVMDADDISYPWRLETQLSFLEKHRHIGLIGSQTEIINSDNHPLPITIIKPTVKPSVLRTLLLYDNYILHPSVMFKKSISDKFNLIYDIKYKYAGDYDFVCRFAQHTAIYNLSIVLLKYRFHPQQISTQSFEAQRSFSNNIRSKLVDKFRVTLCPMEKQLYLKFMRMQDQFTETELMHGRDIFDLLLTTNKKQKLYNQPALRLLFEYILIQAKEKINH